MATFLEAFFVCYEAADFDDVANNVVFEDFDGLKKNVSIPRGTGRETWGKGTLRARSLMRSLALRIATGSNVFLVVLTVIMPSTKSSTHAIP